MKLWQSLYWNMQLDPSEKNAEETVSSHSSSVHGTELFSSLIPYSAHIYSSTCAFHLKCPSIRERSAKMASGDCVLRPRRPVKQPGFRSTCTDSRGSGDDWQREGGQHAGFRGFCESSMRGSLAKVMCGRGFAVTGNMFSRPYL